MPSRGEIRGEAQRCSYVFQGGSKTLNRLLVSAALEAVLMPWSFDVVHINAELADRVSDHDPQVTRFLVSAT